MPEALEILRSCLAPSCLHGNDVGLTAKDFVEYRAAIDDRLAGVSSIISSWTSPNESCLLEDVEVLSLLTIICGEHSTSSLWSTETSLRLCGEIFLSISSYSLRLHNHDIFHDARVIKKVLSLLRPNLLSTTFRCNPAATTCYGWLLKNVQHPILADFLSDTLPTALILADDYEPHNIKLGLDSLRHIIENVPTETLKWYGQDEVILDVLKKCLYLSDPDVVSCHLKCFIALMSCSLRHSTSLKRNNFDGIIKTIFFHMFMEQKLNLRDVYAANLPSLIEARRLGVVRHLTMLLKILSEYTLEPSTTTSALQALVTTIQVCWCRGDSVGEQILAIVMKLLVASSRAPSQHNFAKISPEVRRVVLLLREAFPNVVERFLSDFRQNRSSFDGDFVALVEDICAN